MYDNKLFYVVKGGGNCNFCYKEWDMVETLLRGPTVNICNECVALAAQVIEHDNLPDHLKELQ
jgi:ATP-dependent protease Clp ATPase subunit